MTLEDIVLPPRPDGQVNVWGSNLTFAEDLYGRLGARVLDLVSQRMKIQIVWLKHPERIGEIALHAGLESAALRLGLRPRRVRYCIQRGYPVANAFWDECIRRMLPVRDWLWPIVQVTEQHIAGGFRTRPQWLQSGHSIHSSRDRSGLLERVGPPPSLFEQGEIDAGLDWLRSVGWREGERFVCLLVRDEEFLTTFGGGPGSHLERAKRNSFRDSDVATYVPAAEWLADQGVWVLRMGKTMAKPMPSSHPRIVDYAFREDRSDFLDVWLFANCNLCITTGTGPDTIADVFRRPLLVVNYLPAAYLFSWSSAVTAPGPLVWSDSGRRLSIEELLAADWFHSEDYAEHGVEIRSLDASTLLGIVQEAWGLLTGDWVDALGDARRNQVAWAALEAHPKYANWHGHRHPDARFSSVWLRQLEDELTEHDRPKNA